ncbi:MAG: AraC family transcriptional regulator [Lachnospiraceae bacterium]|jgi:AraC-like DNA-binding protein|nr:AraC family transcriptional regulator [Lachnospiraceae bacterium]
MNITEYENYQEKLNQQGNPFPYLTYLCSIPHDFTYVPLHWHEEMELVYIKKGAGIVDVDFKEFLVSEGDIIFVCPGQLHSIRQQSSLSMEYENIIFPLSLLNGRQPDSLWETYLAPINLRQLSLPPRLSPDMTSYPFISACIDQIDQIRRTFPHGYELLIKGKLYELYFLLYHHGLVTPHKSAPTPRLHSQEKTLEKTRQILKFLEQHYNEPLSIEKLAKAAGFSQSHFMKFFKNTFGRSFTAYLNDYRLTMASRMLLASEDSILTIAAESGFENLSYFNRRFRGKFGMTPREYRKKNLVSQTQHIPDIPVKNYNPLQTGKQRSAPP